MDGWCDGGRMCRGVLYGLVNHKKVLGARGVTVCSIIARKRYD